LASPTHRPPKEGTTGGGNNNTAGIATAKDQYRLAAEAEIVSRNLGVQWADVAGLEDSKRALQEMVRPLALIFH
jgi:ATP-dependent Zn protease